MTPFDLASTCDLTMSSICCIWKLESRRRPLNTSSPYIFFPARSKFESLRIVIQPLACFIMDALLFSLQHD